MYLDLITLLNVKAVQRMYMKLIVLIVCAINVNYLVTCCHKDVTSAMSDSSVKSTKPTILPVRYIIKQLIIDKTNRSIPLSKHFTLNSIWKITII